jgi:hypothetical protein
MTTDQRSKLSNIALAVSLAGLVVALGATMMEQSGRQRHRERARIELQDMQVRLDTLRKGATSSEAARIDALQKELDALKQTTK